MSVTTDQPAADARNRERNTRERRQYDADLRYILSREPVFDRQFLRALQAMSRAALTQKDPPNAISSQAGKK